MALINEVVQVTITQETAAIPQPSFSTVLILGTSNRLSPDLYAVYTDPSQMLIENGGPFELTDPEYIHASELFEQAIVPEEVVIGAASASVAQVETISIPGSVGSGDTYTITIGGQAFSYTAGGSDTATTVLEALEALINAAPSVNVKAVFNSGPVTLSLTAWNWNIQVSSETQGASWPGVGFSISVTSNLTDTHTTANHSMVQDLVAIQNIFTDFYGVNICSDNWWDLLNMGAYIETQTLFFVCTSGDSEILDPNAEFDVLSQLGAKKYDRTSLLYSGSPTDGPDSGWSYNFAITPGSSIWAFSTIVGVDADNLNPTQISTIFNKFGNVYTPMGGVDVTRKGWAVSGTFNDITIGIDWLTAEIQTNIFTLLYNASQAGSKIPYTDQGASSVAQQVNLALQTGANNGLIDPTSIVITVPDVLSVPEDQRAERIAPTITFSARLQGAFQDVIVNGTVSV